MHLSGMLSAMELEASGAAVRCWASHTSAQPHVQGTLGCSLAGLVYSWLHINKFEISGLRDC